VTPAARARRLLRDAQERRRAAFFRRAGRWTPYVAAQLGEEVFVVRTGEEGLQRGLFVRQSRSDISSLERILDWLEEHGVSRPPESVFVDVGANIGTTTVSALRRFGFASAVALEPSPENFRSLRLNLVANDLEERVTALQVAAATHEGTRPLDTDRRHSGGHRLARKGKAERAKEGQIEVRVVTLDGLVREGIVDPSRVGLLWVDAAGDEGKVICGATRLLERGVPIVAALRPRRMKPDAQKALVAALDGYRFVDTAGLHPGATARGVDQLDAALAGGARTLDLLFVSG